MAMKSLFEIKLERNGYVCVGQREVGDRHLEEYADFKTHFPLQTSEELAKKIAIEMGVNSVKFSPYDCRYPLDIVLVYVK